MKVDDKKLKKFVKNFTNYALGCKYCPIRKAGKLDCGKWKAEYSRAKNIKNCTSSIIKYLKGDE